MPRRRSFTLAASTVVTTHRPSFAGQCVRRPRRLHSRREIPSASRTEHRVFLVPVRVCCLAPCTANGRPCCSGWTVRLSYDESVPSYSGQSQSDPGIQFGLSKPITQDVNSLIVTLAIPTHHRSPSQFRSPLAHPPLSPVSRPSDLPLHTHLLGLYIYILVETSHDRRVGRLAGWPTNRRLSSGWYEYAGR